MGVSNIQKQRIIEESAKVHFASGEKPRLLDVLTDASNFFSQFAVGRPLPVDVDNIIPGLRSDVDRFNEVIARLGLNVDVLYEASADQVEKVMTLTTLLRTELQRMRARRIRLLDQIDDKLFSLYNTDGYYFSVSDSFSTLDLVDLSLTSAFVDTESGKVQIPTISSLTKAVDASKIQGMDIQAFVDGKATAFKSLGSIASAFDGLTNTYWGIELTTDKPSEVVVILTISIKDVVEDPIYLSRLDFEPYGMVPVQMFAEVEQVSTGSESSLPNIDFGGSIKTSAYAMSFVDNAVNAGKIIITLRKTEADYVTSISGTTKHRYIFASKNIVMTEQVYDAQATLVTKSLELDEDLVDDNIIDAVALVANAEAGNDTEITFFVAPDTGQTDYTLDDFDWKEITPLSDIGTNANAVVNFEGARAFLRSIKATPGPSDLQLIPLDLTNSDLTKRNPSATIIQGASIYRIAAFTEQDVLPGSITLEEGVNTTRILYTNLNSSGLDLNYWKDYVNGVKPVSTVYGRIDSGNEFFYGGDIGESGKSVYVETYVDSDSDQALLLKNVAKVDPNSRVWDVKVFLNGREVADMPVGINELVVPWKFQQGLNHVAMTINIPVSTSAYPNAYVGTIDLMGDDDLFDFGNVRLATWSYVDLFKMQYNEVGQPYTFTIYNNEIVSRRKPTTNLRVRYSKSTAKAPSGVRLRADLKRSNTNPNATPFLHDYRLRFLYANAQDN